MPLHANGSAYFTQEQWNFAAGEASTLEYVKAQGMPLKKEGSWYRSAQESSLVFAPNGSWFHNSRDLSGNPIQYLTMIEGKGKVEAVLTINGERYPPEAYMSAEDRVNYLKSASAPAKAPALADAPPAPAPEEVKKQYAKPEGADKPKELIMPESEGKNNILLSYLHYKRGIDYEIIISLAKKGDIYQTVRREMLNSATGKAFKTPTNIMFVYRDKEGEIKGGFQRGTLDGENTFKRDIGGSDKANYCFRMLGNEGVTHLKIFEGAIDALSHATLEKEGGTNYKLCHRIAIGGNSMLTSIVKFLEDYPEVTDITLCLDNDKAGLEGISKLGTALTNKGYTVDMQLSKGKDFNEDLVAYRQAQELVKIQNKQKAEAKQPEIVTKTESAAAVAQGNIAKPAESIIDNVKGKWDEFHPYSFTYLSDARLQNYIEMSTEKFEAKEKEMQDVLVSLGLSPLEPFNYERALAEYEARIPKYKEEENKMRKNDVTRRGNEGEISEQEDDFSETDYELEECEP